MRIATEGGTGIFLAMSQETLIRQLVYCELNNINDPILVQPYVLRQILEEKSDAERETLASLQSENEHGDESQDNP